MKVRKVMASRSSDVLWNSKATRLPRSFARLIESYSDKKVTSLTFSGLVAQYVHVVGFSFTKRRRTYLINHGYTFVKVSGCRYC